MVNTPVLFETYTRVETARIVWENIKIAKPRKLYFYSNRANDDNLSDIRKNDEIRSWINEVDWECEIHTFFREKQVDQYTSLLSSKQWLFANEGTGIILEDDCVPSIGFFEFCEHFLEVYKDVKNISFISGNNYTIGYSNKEKSNHIISQSQAHFGWATWKDRFEKIDFDLKPSDIINNKSFKSYYKSVYVSWFYKMFFLKLETFICKTKCWDYVWTLNCIKNKWYVISPIYNLVRNIGVYGEHANGNDSMVFKLDSNNDKQYPIDNLTEKQAVIVPDHRYTKCELKFFGGLSLKSRVRLIRDILYYYINRVH